MEHRKRTGRGMSRPDYLTYLGEVLTPLSNAARVNPFTMFENVPEPDEIAWFLDVIVWWVIPI